MNDRRTFLKALGIGGAGLAFNTLGLGAWMKAAYAAHETTHTAPACGLWGDIEGNVGSSSPWNCGNFPGYKILEIYLRAGASQWETFWLPGNGSAPNFSDFDLGPPNIGPEPGGAGSPQTLDLSTVNWSGNTANFPCEGPDIPPSASDFAQFAAPEAGGGQIYWGAPARPIYRRNDIFQKCRMVTQFHQLFPHEAAIPFTLTGSRLGNPRLAGTGSAIQRRDRVLNPNNLLPVSYVLHTNASGDTNYAAATGSHPGFSRPLVIRVTGSNSFFNDLGRNGITPDSDNLLKSLRHEFRDRLRFRGAGSTVRSQGFDGYWTAAELLESAPSLQTLFENQILVVDGNIAQCADVPGSGIGNTASRGIKTQLHAAATLLGADNAKYICCIDNGIAGSYDTHQINHLETIYTNMYNVMHHLADIIHHPVNNPNGLISLSDTMVVIHTEFGREPWIEIDRGRDHWPVGYVTTLIGGPIPNGPSIGGGIDSSDGYTMTDYRYSPTDVRGAMLLAAGIDPFADGNFNVAAFSDALKSNPVTVSEVEIRHRLRSRILGV